MKVSATHQQETMKNAEMAEMVGCLIRDLRCGSDERVA
jgi:hypothetical protein